MKVQVDRARDITSITNAQLFISSDHNTSLTKYLMSDTVVSAIVKVPTSMNFVEKHDVNS